MITVPIADYGTDVNVLLPYQGHYLVGLDPVFRIVSGPQVLLQACIKRLLTPPGSLAGAPDYGYDLRARLNSTLRAGDLAAIELRAQKELVKDERIAQATVAASFAGNTLRVIAQITPRFGPTFALTLSLTAAAVPVVATSLVFA